MKRNPAQLSKQVYDVLVLGGGIYGVCIAWDAALRGLSVALVEKGDFGHATSSNSLRVIHGGLRYLQHGDIGRLRRSIQERNAFMKIAPHLVHPLPILIPTYGHLLRGKEIFSIALLINKVVGFDWNRLADARRHLPDGRVLSREECLRLFPGVYEKDLTGGIIVYDCQMSSSERLVLSFARSAAQAGAHLTNYVAVTKFIKDGNRINGVEARDVLTGDALPVQSKMVVNASGPWLDQTLNLLNRHNSPPARLVLSKAFNLLISRQLIPKYAVGVYSRGVFKDRDAILHKGSRLFFVLPWYDYSLIGTAHFSYDASPDNFRVTEDEVQVFIDEINQAYPAGDLKPRDVCHVYGGLLPVVDDRPGGIQLVKRHHIYDHQKQDGIAGLMSVSGVKFTEARYVAEKAVDAIFKKLGKNPPKSRTATTPLHGGQIEGFNDFLTEQTRRRSREINRDAVSLLVSHYGSAYSDVLRYLPKGIEGGPKLPDMSRIIEAEVRHGIRQEMAQKLTDILVRRTTLAIPGHLTEMSLNTCVAAMANELAWSRDRVQKEMEEMRAVSFGSIHPGGSSTRSDPTEGTGARIVNAEANTNELTISRGS